MTFSFKMGSPFIFPMATPNIKESFSNPSISSTFGNLVIIPKHIDSRLKCCAAIIMDIAAIPPSTSTNFSFLSFLINSIITGASQVTTFFTPYIYLLSSNFFFTSSGNSFKIISSILFNFSLFLNTIKSTS